MNRLPTIAPALLAAALVVSSARADDKTCSAQSGAHPPAVVELYTSEGCSSCPPADRWASKLKGRSDVLVLGFHVNYWDKLGWPDRFANAQTTERQHVLQRATRRTVCVHAAGGAQRPRPARLVERAAAALGGQPDHGVAGTRGQCRAGQRRRCRGATPRGFLGRARRRPLEPCQGRRELGRDLDARSRGDAVQAGGRVERSNAGQSFTLDLPAATSKSRRVAFVVTDQSGARPLQAAVLGC